MAGCGKCRREDLCSNCGNVANGGHLAKCALSVSQSPRLRGTVLGVAARMGDEAVQKVPIENSRFFGLIMATGRPFMGARIEPIGIDEATANEPDPDVELLSRQLLCPSG